MVEKKKRKNASNRNPKHGEHFSKSPSTVGVKGQKQLTSEDDTDQYPRASDWQLSCVIGVTTFCIYVTTLYPSLPGGDSGEVIAAAHELGVAHPPGYPLFVMLGWLAIKLIPYGTVAWRVNLQTAAFSATAVALLTQVALKLTKRSSSAMFVVGAWGWCSLTWTWSITAEVFGLNNLFVAAILLLMLYFDEAEEQDKCMWSCLGAFTCGLSLCNQHTMVVYVAVVALWVLHQLFLSKMLDLLLVIKLSLCFLLGLTPYIFIPLSSWIQWSRWTWGDQRSVSGFLTHLLRMEYGTFDLGKDETGQGILFGLQFYAGHIGSDLIVVSGVLFCIGAILIIYRFFRGERSVKAVMFIMLLTYVLFFCWRANLDLKNPLFIGVVERFWMQSDIIVVIIAALGYDELFRFLSKYWKLLDKTQLDIIFTVILSVFQLVKNYQLCDQSHNTVIHELGERILQAVPPHSLILTKGDLPSNSLRYLQICENIRDDIQVFDQEVLTYEWSIPMLSWSSPNITFPGNLMHLRNEKLPDGRTSFNFQRFLDANYNKGPIFGCIGVQDHENSWQAGYELWPFGVCSQFIRKGQPPNLADLVNTAQIMSKDWQYPFNGFAETSWERVATNEMWHAKINAAYFLYGKAESSTAVEHKQQFLTASYQLYTSAIEGHVNIPSFWHKNYALVCERMLRIDQEYNKLDLANKTITHFQNFLQKEATDPDREAIENVINSLKIQLKSMGQIEAQK